MDGQTAQPGGKAPGELPESPDRKPDARSRKRDFPYAAYFSEVDVMPALLMMPDEIPWLRQAPRNPAPHETVLYLGCQALKTPHFCQEAIDVLESLGETVVTIGGPAVCCGSVHENFGHDLDLAEGAGKSTTRKLASFAPENVLTICPNCTHQYEHGVISQAGDLPFDMTHFYEHVHANLGRLDFAACQDAPPRRIGLHRHLGSSHHQDEHGDLCAAILGAIPGVEVVELPARDDLLHLCYPRGFRRIDDAGWTAFMDSLFGAARDAGCVAVANIYHACQRELAIEAAARRRRGDDPGVAIESVVGLLARAVGRPPREDRLMQLCALGSVDAVLDAVAPNIAAHRIPEDVARRVVSSVLFS